MIPALIALMLGACALSFFIGAIVAGGKRAEYEYRLLILSDAATDALALLRRFHREFGTTNEWYEITQLEQALTDHETEQ